MTSYGSTPILHTHSPIAESIKVHNITAVYVLNLHHEFRLLDYLLSCE